MEYEELKKYSGRIRDFSSNEPKQTKYIGTMSICIDGVEYTGRPVYDKKKDLIKLRHAYHCPNITKDTDLSSIVVKSWIEND